MKTRLLLLFAILLLLIVLLVLALLPQHGLTLQYATALALLLTANRFPEVALPLIIISIVLRFLIELEAFILTFDQ
jgi:hypothetical protein